jgi:nucleotide-binding universal stress UspA family protein
MEPFGKIVVAVDFEAASQRAVDTAIAMARTTSASVTLLHVYALTSPVPVLTIPIPH